MDAAAEVETIPTGFSNLDEALGIGGIPCGRISELFGADTSGKHALAASIAAQCQKQQGVVVWIDPAERLDPEQMRALEVDTESILVARPRSEMDALEMAVRLARSGGVRMIVLEMPPSRGIEASAGRARSPLPAFRPAFPAKASIPEDRPASLIRPWAYTRRPYGLPQSSVPSPQPSSMGLALRRLVAAVHRNNIAFLFISPSFHSSSTQHSALSTQHSRGGQALRYFASVRLEIERRGWIRRGRDVVGCRSAVRVVKNKLAAPEREAEMDLRFVACPMPVD